MKNKLINYLATGALVAGSLLPFGCERRSLEGKLNQIGVQASQKVGSFKENLYKRLESEYIKFVPAPYAYKNKEEEKRDIEWMTKSLKDRKECDILPFLDKNKLIKTHQFLKNYDKDITILSLVKCFSKYPEEYYSELNKDIEAKEYLKKFRFPLNLREYSKKHPEDDLAKRIFEMGKEYEKEGLDLSNLKKEEFYAIGVEDYFEAVEAVQLLFR